MKQLPILLLAGLLLAAPASQLSAHRAPVLLLTNATLSDATAQRVLQAAAPLFGTSAERLYSGYQAGSVTITNLGPVRGGTRYEVSQGNLSFILDEIATN
jgi:hypothetical protein